MHFTQLFATALASGAALAAAVPAPAPAPIQVGEDDVILYGSGRYKVIKRSEFDELEQLRKNKIVPPKPAYLDDTMYHGPSNDTGAEVESHSSHDKRWKTNTVIVRNPKQRFLGWDTLMSQVVKGAPTTITVSTGFTITNTITVSQGASFTLVKDFLEASMSIDYSESWASAQTQMFAAPVPEGKFGAFVSNPWTNRESGNVFKGVIGSEGELTYYQADSFESKQFDNMAWVDGVIGLCTGDTLPLKRCLGEGTL
ncbi:hypothetical protein BS50DRAFT_566884 [Corynespora cassiicola Philippines]|uniref:Celp0028 effector like protein n=1 Tax=Corynespora cassiicola Philippines TaxID=1448308 RepID=A0A2T2P8J5_CORCC|nr:hypothetical protein BS50DRAFT_566884 [Corynespora cassiicola Philippines]